MDQQTLSQLRVVNETNIFLYAVCPWHDESEGSLCINKVLHRGHRKGFYYCFGCQAKGQISEEEVDALSLSDHVFTSPTANKDLYQLQMEYYTREFREDHAKELAEKWGVSPLTLSNLGCGFDKQSHTFPMYNGKEEIIGIQRRFTNGFKCMVEGSTLGLFIPNSVTSDHLVVTEGVSDLAAAMELGFQGIARPNALVGKEMVYEWLKHYSEDWKVVIIADNDEAGQKGALELRDYIDSEHGRTAIWTPSCANDLNECFQTVGAFVTRAEIEREFDGIRQRQIPKA